MISIRAAAPEDLSALEMLVSGRGLVVGDGLIGDGSEAGELAWLTDPGTYVAESFGRLVGTYRLHQRNVGVPGDVDVEFLAIASGAPVDSLDRLLVEDARDRARTWGAERLTLVVRSPLTILLDPGAELLWIESPSTTASAGLRMTLPV